MALSLIFCVDFGDGFTLLSEGGLFECKFCAFLFSLFLRTFTQTSIFSLTASLLGFTNFIPLCRGKVSLCAYPNTNNSLTTLQDPPLDANRIHTNANNCLGFYFVFTFFFGGGGGFLFYLARLIQALAQVV